MRGPRWQGQWQEQGSTSADAISKVKKEAVLRRITDKYLSRWGFALQKPIQRV
jgi:hypothetical protein